MQLRDDRLQIGNGRGLMVIDDFGQMLIIRLSMNIGHNRLQTGRGFVLIGAKKISHDRGQVVDTQRRLDLRRLDWSRRRVIQRVAFEESILIFAQFGQFISERFLRWTGDVIRIQTRQTKG